ncbi:hypothetical protein T4B_13245 [Trichinella pseudospiralis]|uniref:Uncharacterized protein n=1 Tax=Trichinella pseudospiralis TaxID=6337 RepID=A0A0V1J672_TRIPS|nr:hypothetical protein T4B_13245 [Trichinella pseudospiralis]
MVQAILTWSAPGAIVYLNLMQPGALFLPFNILFKQFRDLAIPYGTLHNYSVNIILKCRWLKIEFCLYPPHLQSITSVCCAALYYRFAVSLTRMRFTRGKNGTIELWNNFTCIPQIKTL